MATRKSCNGPKARLNICSCAETCDFPTRDTAAKASFDVDRSVLRDQETGARANASLCLQRAEDVNRICIEFNLLTTASCRAMSRSHLMQIQASAMPVTAPIDIQSCNCMEMSNELSASSAISKASFSVRPHCNARNASCAAGL